MKVNQAVVGIAKSAVAPSLFNTRGVIAQPTFVLIRKFSSAKLLKEPHGIEFTVRAHAVEEGQWIAEPGWACRADGLPMDVSPLHSGSKRFESRSEAVEAAMDRGLRMVRAQKHRTSDSVDWATKVESLREWMATAITKVRDNDETLPLRGMTVIDLFAGGHGGFSMGLMSLGAKVELACEIDPEAMAVYRKNVRPLSTHGDICTLDCSKTKVDFVTVGLLCQAFSPAGNGLGFADPVLANAYKHAMRVLGEVDAKVVIVECARRFLTLDAGKHCDEFIATMNAAGYRVQARAMNAAGFGVPQDRERSILICTRIGVDVDSLLGYVFPDESAPTACVADIMEPDLPATLMEDELTDLQPEPAIRVGKMHRVGFVRGKNSQGYRVYSPKGVGISLLAGSGGAAQFTGAYRVPGGARPLTPREAARMQGMPEWSAQHENRRHALRHAGNAIALPLARELARQFKGVSS